MDCLYKFLKTIEEVIQFFETLIWESFEVLEVDLQVILDQLKAILFSLSRIVEGDQMDTPLHLTFCRQRGNRLVFPQLSRVRQGSSAATQEERQVVLVPIAKIRVHLQTQPKSVDCQVLELISQIHISEIDNDGGSDLPDLIDHKGNIVN